MKVLTIDVGGTHVKMLAAGIQEPVKFPSGPEMTPAEMAERVKIATQGWKYQAISLGYPGPVVKNKPVLEPHNLAAGWIDFDFQKAFGHPVKLINDAAMQALGSYEGGRMLFLGLGTGLGSAMVAEDCLEPLELAHLPYRKEKTFEDYAGARGLERMGPKKWRKHVGEIIRMLRAATQTDYAMLGGGNAKLLEGAMPEGSRMGNNANAFTGGYRLWEKARRGK